MIYIYLAGPITGLNFEDANDWRRVVSDDLKHSNIIGISPLRCESLKEGETYNASYNCPKFGEPLAIASKNFLDVQKCDLLLAYLPKISIGTLIEIGWAIALQKPVIVVSKLPEIREHSILNAKVGWMLESFEDAVDVIFGLFEDYVVW